MSDRFPLPDEERGLAWESAWGTQSAGGDTVDDLLKVSAERKSGVPPLLVLTLLVQLLKALRDLHARGAVHGALSPRSLALSGRRAEALFEDPSRDPGLELLRRAPVEAFLAPEVRSGSPAGPASDLYSAGAVARALLAGGPGGRPRLGALEPLIDGLVRSRPEARWPITKALEEARTRALEHFEEWDRNRHADRLRRSLEDALASRSRARVEDHLLALSEVSPRDPSVAAARRWLTGRSRRESELRHRLTRAMYLENVREAAWREQQLHYFLAERAAADGDLEIARRWLGEQAEAAEQRRERVKRSRRKLLLTAVPMAFALGLIVLLVWVLVST